MKYLHITAALLATSAAATVLHSNPGPKYMFVFGDSFTSTNFDINGAQPNSSNPTGNMDLGDHNTTALGSVWVDFLTTNYNTSAVSTYNFAAGGASIPDNYTYQIDNLYQPKYTTSKFWKGCNTLHASWIGINDVSDAWVAKNNSVITPRLNLYSQRLETMYNTGARNFFIVNVPPLDRSPFVSAFIGEDLTASHYKSYVQFFNGNLTPLVHNFQQAHPEALVMLYDVHTFFTKVLNKPTAFGFRDNICQDDVGCLWEGNFHISSAFHKLIAKDMAEEIRKYAFKD